MGAVAVVVADAAARVDLAAAVVVAVGIGRPAPTSPRQSRLHRHRRKPRVPRQPPMARLLMAQRPNAVVVDGALKLRAGAAVQITEPNKDSAKAAGKEQG